jgi:hypothetical protein
MRQARSRHDRTRAGDSRDEFTARWLRHNRPSLQHIIFVGHKSFLSLKDTDGASAW